MPKKQEKRLIKDAPVDALSVLVREATASVEADLALEDAGWLSVSGQTGEVIKAPERITNLKLSRRYALLNPLGKQSIRLWTDYTFGTGMTWDTEDDPAKKALEAFWDSPDNQRVLSDIGQRKSSDKLLTDGEMFFALFLGPNGQVTIRRIDPLEITEIITDGDDLENVLYYRRQWSDSAGKPHVTTYRSTTNIKGVSGKDSTGTIVEKTDDALVYHLAINTIGQRGNPLLLPALLWMKYHTLQLSSYIAVDLAQSKFVLRSKVKGGQNAVDTVKAVTEGKEINAGSTLLENEGVDTTGFSIDKRAANAYKGSRLTKLQVCASVGISEQYYGDIATGNLATAKTVELPMMKMFQSYQQVWATGFKDINDIVFEHNNIASEKRYVDINFPAIAPAAILEASTAIKEILGVLPQFGDSPDVQQQAMLALGVNDPKEAIEQIEKTVEKNPSRALTKALKQFRETIKNNGH